MARPDERTTEQMACTYSNIAVALNDALKTPSNSVACDAMTKTLVGVCGLIDQLVSKQHRELPDSTRCSG